MFVKRGQMEISFGMIFSIILIIAFLAVASYAIIKFLDLNKNVTTNQFVNNLQTYIDELWQGSQGSIGKTLNAPSDVRLVCFFDSSSTAKPVSNQKMFDEISDFSQDNENMAFYPLTAGDRNYFEIKHVNITQTTRNKNPYCFENEGGKIAITIEKKFENGRLESLVTLR